MPKYLIIAYLKSHVNESIFTLFTDDDEMKARHVDSLMDNGFRVTVYEWYVPKDVVNEMPYYKILCECFKLGY